MTENMTEQPSFAETQYYRWLENFMKTFTDEDMKKYTKEALFFELRNAYVKGYVDGGNKLATGCKHEKTHLERVRGWQQFYPYIPAKLYCNDCGKEITEE